MKPMRPPWLGALLAFALACVISGADAQVAPSEVSVKAAYLYKFLAYVEWPESALSAGDSPLVIGVADAEAIEAELRNVVAGRSVNGHPIAARTLKAGDSFDAVHVVFVGRPSALPAWVDRLHGRPVLVISDAPNSVEQGSMLGLVLVDGRIRFEAAPSIAERAGLRLSARLLAVADRVVTR